MTAPTLQHVKRLRQLPALSVVALRRYLSSLADPSKPLLPFIPKTVKIILLLLIIINSPSLPFQWHIRVWRYPLKAYFDLFTKGRDKFLGECEQRSLRHGGITERTRLKRIAWFDDCDYNLHLSNSCYAKNVDAARMKWAIDVILPAFRPGIHMALGATHYVFVKEIPLGSEYVMETRAGGWDEKWIYLVTEYIIYPKKAARGKGKRPIKPDPTPAGPSVPTLVGPSSTGDSTPEANGSSTPTTTMEAVRKAASLRSRMPREDGGIVCCLAVAEYCFKQGRVTVPPRIVLHLGMVSPNQSDRELARDRVLNSKDQGAKWVRGGWREEPDAMEIGASIGDEINGGDDKSFTSGWVEKSREGMEQVNAGLSVF
ncbi:hypothetical protein BD324DRAFT_618540 [Kockovaella imperatae]|uniref:HotDog domain-containing protein n=1 Tax=Kockovaella imperatae TaxID=4999 RepID=A0A1Y1UM79_9TREE|nr:hypothetical protein BD324DRAFT_618540 [Kockovaella imperatae]ORX39109.1 hypothetical protein BD324DRAFT_618540 [Kockovaella imperatae]